MQTLERKSIELPMVDYVGRQSYDELFDSAQILAKEYDIDTDIQDATFELLDELRVYDEDVAIGGLRTLPIAFEVVDEIKISKSDDFDIDNTAVFSSSLLHDIGKKELPKELLIKSHTGLEWTKKDTLLMRQHVYFGGVLLRERKVPNSIVRPIEEHHRKQQGGNEYGVDPYLDEQERICRDAIAIADFAEADINRTNTRNRNLTRNQRELEIAADIAYVLDDYLDCLELTTKITNRILG